MDGRYGCVTDDGLILVARQDEARAVDAHAIGTCRVPGQVLMENAGLRAAMLFMARLGDVPGRAVVLCGPGNNGGDGYVIARHLRDHGWRVEAIATAPPRDGSDAARAAELWQTTGGVSEPIGPRLTARHRHLLNHATLIVDALFGTGLSRAPDATTQDLIDAANAAPHALRCAVDIPSGLDGALGLAYGSPLRAALTATFGLLKQGLLTSAGPDLAGDVVALPIGWPLMSVTAIGPTLRRPLPAWVASYLPRRDPSGHKGTSGHVAVIGGSAGKEGAAILAARGALRAGCGLVTWVRREPPVDRPPEVMAEDPFNSDDLRATIASRATVLLIGPGLGQGPDTAQLIAAAIADPRPTVFDADALDATALVPLATATGQIVLTPHPLEAARLLGMTTAEIQADRVLAAETISARYSAVCVLKGRNTVVSAPNEPTFILDITAPALSTGGTGDVLAGVIASLMAQGLTAHTAAVVGAEVHGRAGREAPTDRGIFASEIADRVPTVISELIAGWAT